MTLLMRMTAFVCFFFLFTGLSAQGKESSKDSSQQGTGLTQKDIEKLKGKYQLSVSDPSHMWGNKVITIKDVKEVSSGQPSNSIVSYQAKAYSTVPAYWDTTDKLELDQFFITVVQNQEKKKAQITKIKITFSLSLKEKGNVSFEFTGYPIPGKKMFAGILKTNGQEETGFILEKVK